MVVLINGTFARIGYMIAEGFVCNGARVWICSRSEKEGVEACKRLSKKGQCKFIQADLANDNDLSRVCSQLSTDLEQCGLDVLVNNAGTNWSEPLDTYSTQAFRKVIKLNLEVAFTLSQRLKPLLCKAAKPESPSRIINIGSIHGIYPPSLPTFAYSASKAAIHMLSKHLASQLAQNNITVNSVAPGPFESKMMREILDKFGNEIKAGLPLARIGLPTDIAAVCIWLASMGGSFVTGTTICVDGGSLIQRKSQL